MTSEAKHDGRQPSPTLLEAALYALRRVGSDPDFRHHMLMTETMDLLCRAVAATTGKDFETLKREYSMDRQPEYRRLEPQLVVERRRVRVLERVTERLASDAGVSWEKLEALRDAELAKESS